MRFFPPAQLLVCAFCGIGKRDLVVFASLEPRTIPLGSCNMKLLQMKLGHLELMPRSCHCTSESLVWWMHFHMKPSSEQIISQVYLRLSWVDMFPCPFLPHKKKKKCEQTKAELFSFPPSLTVIDCQLGTTELFVHWYPAASLVRLMLTFGKSVLSVCGKANRLSVLQQCRQQIPQKTSHELCLSAISLNAHLLNLKKKAKQLELEDKRSFSAALTFRLLADFTGGPELQVFVQQMDFAYS